MTNKITYAIKLDSTDTAELKVIAKEHERTLSGEIRHVLKCYIKEHSAPKLEKR